MSSRRARFLEYAVGMLDASRALLRNLEQKPSLVPPRTSEAGVPDQEELVMEDVGDVEGEGDEEGLEELGRYPSGPGFVGFPDDNI